jgi:hypothetical protein
MAKMARLSEDKVAVAQAVALFSSIRSLEQLPSSSGVLPSGSQWELVSSRYRL